MTDTALSTTPVAAEIRTPRAVTWATWPLLFLSTLAVLSHAIALNWSYGATLGALTAGSIAVLVALEWAYPLDQRWRMTARTFFERDLKFLLAGIVTLSGINYALGLIGLNLASGHRGPLSDWPLWLAVSAAILAFDFLQYWQHRWSHEADNVFKQFLWKTHAAHHLPQQVYVLMHPAAHPLNTLLIQAVIRVPLFYWLGLSPEALMVVTAIIGLQGLVSHCNVDLRAGWFNYLLTGTELHRVHHGADHADGRNYAVVVSLIDVIFGTFDYRPGRVPQRLGVIDPGAYPRSDQFWRIMLIPFRR
jgi:sterol desaturase/sphingolipid hydroxylase (fatty acid hydroxylase superfamily)